LLQVRIRARSSFPSGSQKTHNPVGLFIQELKFVRPFRTCGSLAESGPE
jgi:hypothetical protein